MSQSLKMALRVLLPLTPLILAAMAFPNQTTMMTQVQPTPTVTDPASALITRPARCTDGSTLLHTTDCTMGTPVSYCYKPQPPIKCNDGYFPSVWHPDHCMEESTCFPLNAMWITTECSNGAVPYTTTTLYDGTLAGGSSTVISGES